MARVPRQIGLNTILDLGKQKKKIISIALVLILLPLSMGTILLLLFIKIDADIPYVDFATINKNGKSAIATITNIQTQNNITINNQHPFIITYTYSSNGKEIENTYRALDPNKVNRINIGDTVQVKHLADSSIIIHVKPFEFPFYILFEVLFPCLLIGLTILGILVFQILRKINLYRYGEIKQANVLSIKPKNLFPFTSLGAWVQIKYQYHMQNSQFIVGETSTSNLELLKTIKPADTIKIIVSSTNQTQSCLIPQLEQIRSTWST